MAEIDVRLREALAGAAREARFDTSRWGPPRRRRRPAGRFVAVAAALALLVGVVAPLVVLSVLEGPRPERRTDPAASLRDPRTWDECRVEAPDQQVIDPPAGPPGTLIEVRGGLDTGVEGEPGPAPERFRIWWNLDPASWESALTGDPRPAVAGRPVFELKRQFLSYSRPRPGAEGRICPYQTMVDAPDEPPGTYPIVVLYGGNGAEPTWSSLPAVEFALAPGCPGSGPRSDPGCPEAA